MYGMSEKETKILKSLCDVLKGNSFVAGQACEVVGGKTAEVLAVLEDLCVLGALECPQTRGLEVPRYRVSRECERRLSA